MRPRRSAYDELDQYVKEFEASLQPGGNNRPKFITSEAKVSRKATASVRPQPSSSANLSNSPILDDKTFKQRVVKLDDEIEHFARRIELTRSSRLKQLRQLRQTVLSEIAFTEELDAAAYPNGLDAKYVVDEEFQSFLLGESEPSKQPQTQHSFMPELSLETVTHLQLQRKAHRSKLRQLSQNIEDTLSQSVIHTNTHHNHIQQLESNTQQKATSQFNSSPMSAMTGSDSESPRRTQQAYTDHRHKANTQNSNKLSHKQANTTVKASLDKVMRHDVLADIFSDDITGSPPLPPPARSTTQSHNKTAATNVKKTASNNNAVMEGFLTHSRSQSRSQSFDDGENDNYHNEIPSLAELPQQQHSRRSHFYDAQSEEREELEVEEEEFDLFELASSHLDQFMDDDNHHHQLQQLQHMPKTPTAAPVFS